MVAKPAKAHPSKVEAVSSGLIIKSEVTLVDTGSGPAQIPAPGVKNGDIILKLVHVSDTADPPDDEDFDHVVRADGSITQFGGNYVGLYVAILCRFT